MMRRALLAAVLLAWSSAVRAETGTAPPPGWDPARYMRVEDVVPGMRGVGRTVFTGNRIETFEVELLGVLTRPSPSGDMVLARLHGHGLDTSGVVAGMSGSPIFVDGKLLGALAYGWSFSLEPITGITPIAEMLRLEGRSAGSPAGASRRAGGDPERWQRLWAGGDKDALAVLAEAWPGPGDGFTPLRVPVSVGGFAEGAGRDVAAFLDGRGFLAVPGGRAATAAPPATLEPGGAVGVELVRGDAQMAAIGTVTWADGDRILAFGHPMMGLGPAVYPMATASIVTVMPRASTSFKMGVVQQTVGTIVRDYDTGIMGALGPAPRLIPFDVEVDFGTRRERLHYEMLDTPSLTPMLAGFLAQSSLEARGSSFGASTLRLRVTVELEDGRRAEANEVVASFSPPAVLAGQVARLVGLVHDNPFEAVAIRRVDARVSVAEGIEAAYLEGISIPPGPARPGEDLPVVVQLRDHRGQTWTHAMSLPVPSDLPPGTYRLTACDADQDARQERERAPGRYEPRSLDGLFALLAEERPQDRLILRLVAPDPSSVVAGRELPRVPPSMVALLSSPSASARNERAGATVIRTVEEQLGKVLIGCEAVTVTVKPGP